VRIRQGKEGRAPASVVICVSGPSSGKTKVSRITQTKNKLNWEAENARRYPEIWRISARYPVEAKGEWENGWKNLGGLIAQKIWAARHQDVRCGCGPGKREKAPGDHIRRKTPEMCPDQAVRDGSSYRGPIVGGTDGRGGDAVHGGGGEGRQERYVLKFGSGGGPERG